MNLPSLRPTRPFFFSLFVVSVLAAKLLHLVQHGHSLGLLHFVIYLPTFFIPDVLACAVLRLVLHGHGTKPSALSITGMLVGSFVTFFCFVASASQLGFYYVTGAEMQWEAAYSVAADPTGLRLLLTGTLQVGISGLFLLVATLATTPFFYNIFGAALGAIAAFVAPSNWSWDRVLPTVRTKANQTHQRIIRVWPLVTLVSLLSLITLQSIRPSRPYDHISSTLPVSLLRIFHTPTVDACSLLEGDAFPLAETVAKANWERPRGNFKGWAPGNDNYMVNRYKNQRPNWLPKKLPQGFYRWEAKLNATRIVNVGLPPPESRQTGQSGEPKCPKDQGPSFYNPVADPLRISNMDADVYEPLKQAFDNSDVLVSHIILVSMESQRKELFPLREGSHLHDNILASHKDLGEKEKLELNQLLSKMTPVAEQITGESFWNDREAIPKGGNSSGIQSAGWKDTAAPGMGGLNVKGAITGSTLSFKSVLGSHCGVYPLPVDFMEETNTKIYQPCIPQILNLFNQAKLDRSGGKSRRDAAAKGNDGPQDHREAIQGQKWRTINIQSTTDKYDRQGKMNRQMSFQETITREKMDNQRSKYYSPKSKELNYFGYPDTDAKPFFRDAVDDAVSNGSRLFISHFTSATHHPWKVPKGFNSSQYLPGSSHEHMNSYLNTIRFIDGWLGDILGVLDEAGVANETLVVFVGDHGQAFEEDTKMTGTYKNPHISNFRVPIVFRHPNLPRIEIAANATSMSILPTILDLLVSSNSLDKYDTSVAADLVHEYQGQSLLRPFRTTHNDRQQWNIGIINAGGAMLSVTSAAVSWRIIVPLQPDFMYRFSDLSTDPNELDPLEEWSFDELVSSVQTKHGEQAARWAEDADKVTHWWVKDMHRVWNYEMRDHES